MELIRTYIEKRKLKRLQPCDMPKKDFAFSGKKVCRVVGVHDGDTVKVVFFNNKVLIRYSVRLVGINAPELKTGVPGQESKQYLHNRVFGKVISVDMAGWDKIGRILGVLYVKDVNINQEMLAKNLAIPYKC